MIQTTVEVTALLLLTASFLRAAEAAGSCEGIKRGESCGAEFVRSVETQTLHLKDGEEARTKVWGGGMLEEELVVDVLVAGGGSAGTAAALAAARNGATVVLVDGRPVKLLGSQNIHRNCLFVLNCCLYPSCSFITFLIPARPITMASRSQACPRRQRRF